MLNGPEDDGRPTPAFRVGTLQITTCGTIKDGWPAERTTAQWFVWDNGVSPPSQGGAGGVGSTGDAGIEMLFDFKISGALTDRLLVVPPSGGQPASQVLADENASGAVSWLLPDNQGTIRDVAQYNAGTGITSIVDHLKYDSFGNITAQSNSAYQPLFAYTGMQWDSAAGLYYDHARWYDPHLGRFISQDPTSFAAGDVNLYRYVGNAPGNGVDPSGLKSSSSKSTPGTPLPGPVTKIPGFPKKLPPVGQVEVIVATRGNHSFIIILDSNGQTRYISGRANKDGILVVTTGPYGTGDEEYHPEDTEYKLYGPNPADVERQMLEYMKEVNALMSKYGYNAKNCNYCTSGALKRGGIDPGSSPYRGDKFTPPGWVSGKSSEE